MTTTQTKNLSDAERYLARGWKLAATPPRSKVPRGERWQLDFIDTAEKLAARMQPGDNVNVLSGTVSGNLLDVDLDTASTRAAWKRFGIRTDARFGRASSPESHWLYQTDVAKPTVRLKGPNNETLIEARSGLPAKEGEEHSQQTQTVFPPSIHQSGEVIAWAEDGEPAKVRYDDLMERVKLCAAAALLADAWPGAGSRHDTALAVGGMFALGGVAEAQAIEIVGFAATFAGDSEVRNRVQDVKGTYRNLSTGRPLTGAPTLSEIIGEKPVAKLREYLRLRDRSQAEPLRIDEPLPTPVAATDQIGRTVFDWNSRGVPVQVRTDAVAFERGGIWTNIRIEVAGVPIEPYRRVNLAAGTRYGMAEDMGRRDPRIPSVVWHQVMSSVTDYVVAGESRLEGVWLSDDLGDIPPARQLLTIVPEGLGLIQGQGDGGKSRISQALAMS